MFELLKRWKWPIVLGLALVALVAFAACGDDGEVAPEVTFDGENCRYEGPEVVSEGNVIFVFNNLSDPGAHLHVVELREGITWQDILELARPVRSQPREVIEPPVRFVEGDPDVQEYALKPGSHGVLCVIHGVDAWPAAPLEVES